MALYRYYLSVALSISLSLSHTHALTQRGYIESDPSREGIIPVNYVLEITAVKPE